MKIEVRVTPKAKIAKVQKVGDVVKVSVNAAPDKGKANEQVRRALADHYGVAVSQVEIIKGETARKKIVIIHL